ncbi:MAG: hypothetical protein JXB48_05525 [Candidatus Latescibacteria bacterium]|nr:hypothetical protein [Candidatus Latescibacterota bacterium]
MKKVKNLLFLMLFAGCLLPASRSMRGLLSSIENYSVSIKKEGDVTSIGSIMPDIASLFVEFGCDSCLVAEITGTEGSYDLEMVTFLKSKGAMGAYLSSDLAGSNPLELGFMGRENDNAVEFLKGRHMVLIRPKSGSAIPGAKNLAYIIEKRIPGDAIKPDVYESLPKSAKVDGSELYFVGPKSFALGFSPDLAGALNLGGAIEGNAAEYMVDDEKVVFIMVKYTDRQRTLSAVNNFVSSRSDLPLIQPRETLQYFTMIEPDKSETYIAENGEWLYLMLNSPRGSRSQEFFEYILRGGR